MADRGTSGVQRYASFLKQSRRKTAGFSQYSEKHLFGANELLRKLIGFFSRIGKNSFALLAEREVNRSGNFLSGRSALLENEWR
jgi:hypothetical protein